MTFFKSTAPSAKQLERREKIRAKGRKHFIVYSGILGWGMSVFALTTLWDLHDKFGWHLPHRGSLYYESGYIAFSLVLWLTLGYFFGAAMWKRFGFEDSTKVGPKS